MCSTDRSVDRVLAGLEGILAADVALMPDEAIRDELLALLTASNQLHAAVASRVAAFDARGMAVADGFRTAKGWLTAFGRRSAAGAVALVRSARVLRQLPALAAVVARGEASAEHVAKVSQLAEQVGAAVTRDADAALAEAAVRMSPADLGRVCERIRAYVDPDGPEPDAAFERRAISLSRLHDMIVVRGQLDAEGGAAVIAALDALMAPAGDGDNRTAAQRRADALVQLARDALVDGRLPTVGGTRPQVGVLLTPQSLLYGDDRADPRTRLLRRIDGLAMPPPGTGDGAETGNAGEREPGQGGIGEPGAGDRTAGDRKADDRRAGDRGAGDYRARKTAGAGHGRAGPSPPGSDPLADLGVPPTAKPAWLDWFGDIPAALAQRVACDADIWSVVLDPATGLPLHLGRGHRLVPAWMRKALHARDRGCRWPGCDAPAAWTDAHHVQAWYHGGPTDIDNLLLLCRWHHHLVHEGQWRLRLESGTGQVSITQPDGRPYGLGPSQPWITPTARRDEGLSDAA